MLLSCRVYVGSSSYSLKRKKHDFQFGMDPKFDPSSMHWNKSSE